MKKGFTLIEVLLAAAILGLGLTVLLTGASQCMRVIRRAREYQMAHWVLGRGEADHPPVASSEPDDLVVDAVEYDGLTYSREVDDDEDEDDLYVVREKVTWPSRGRESVEEVVRYVLIQKDESKGK